MDRLFGTDGIRGRPGEYPLTDGMIFKLGKAAAHLLLCQRCQKKATDGHLKIVIGKDTRLSSQRIEVVLVSGISSYGVDVLLAGVISTPGLAFLTKKFKADMGVMISGSDNGAEENEIKFFSPSGHKLSKAQQDTIKELIFSYSIDLSSCNCGESGSVYKIEDYRLISSKEAIN